MQNRLLERVHMPRELDKILNLDEKVLWEGNPRFAPFVISAFFISMVGLPFLVVILLASLAGLGLRVLLLPHFWVGLGLVIGPPLYRWLVYRHVWYAITDKRAIIQTGVVGRDFKIVDYDQISNAEVNVGFWDKIFGTGSILLYTAGGAWATTYDRRGTTVGPPSFSHVPNPYEVFKTLKKVSFDIKAELEYPTELRPKFAKGYKTKYEPEE